MSSINNNPNLSALDKFGVPVKPFEIVTTAIDLADLVYKVGNLFLKINFHAPKIDVKRIYYAVRRRGSKRKSGVIIKLGDKKIFPPETNGKGNAVDPNTFLVDTTDGRYEIKPTKIPIIAAGGSILADSGSPYKLKILAFNKRIKIGKNSSWETEEESDAAIVNLWFRNPFVLQSFMINDKGEENLPHAKNVEKVIMKLRLGYDQGNPNDLNTSGLKTCQCDFSISCSPHVTNPSVDVEPRHSADIGVTRVEGSSISVNAKNLALETSRFFVFVIGYHHRGITDKPIEGIKEYFIQKAQVKGITEAKVQRGDKEYYVTRDWTIPIQFPAAVSTRVKIQES